MTTNKSPRPLSPQATLPGGETWTEAWRRECEARDWIKRYMEHRKQRGSRFAQLWWDQTKEQIRKVRGQAGLDTLIADMNKEQNATGGKS